MNKETMIACLKEVRAEMTWKKIACIILGAAICTFGVHNIHQRVEITEGGIIGLMLLIEHWLGIPSAVITPVLDIICYAMAFRLFGGKFIVISMISTLSVSAFYEIWELLPPMLPDLSSMPVAAAIAGGLFVGIGTGLISETGRFRRRRRCSGPDDIPCDRMETGNIISFNRHDDPFPFR